MTLHWKTRDALVRARKRADTFDEPSTKSKYKNVKCEWQGEKFDSKRELERHLVLLDMQKRREIFKLERQPKFHLVVNGWSICTYIADWRYRDDGGQSIVEDCKGFATREWKIKWALAKALNPSSEFITS